MTWPAARRPPSWGEGPGLALAALPSLRQTAFRGLRPVALLAALALHVALLAALLLWPRPPPPPPLEVEAVALQWSGFSGTQEAGIGAPLAPSAPSPGALAPDVPVPDAPAPDMPAPDAPAPHAPDGPAEAPASPVEVPMEAPMPPAEAAPVTPAPASPPAPAAAVPPLPLPPPAPPPPPAATLSALPSPQLPAPLRLGAGASLAEGPGAETRAGRPRDTACSDAIEYPATLHAAGIAGEVVLRLRLTDKGRVIEAKLAQSSGHPQLDEAVRAGVRRCRFDPALREGVPVWSSLTWRVTFRP